MSNPVDRQAENPHHSLGDAPRITLYQKSHKFHVSRIPHPDLLSFNEVAGSYTSPPIQFISLCCRSYGTKRPRQSGSSRKFFPLDFFLRALELYYSLINLPTTFPFIPGQSLNRYPGRLPKFSHWKTKAGKPVPKLMLFSKDVWLLPPTLGKQRGERLESWVNWGHSFVNYTRKGDQRGIKLYRCLLVCIFYEFYFQFSEMYIYTSYSLILAIQINVRLPYPPFVVSYLI